MIILCPEERRTCGMRGGDTASIGRILLIHLSGLDQVV